MADAEAIGGLTGTQVALGGSKLLPKPRTKHPYVVGLVITTLGVFTFIGSVTGTLPSMLAALFVPQALEDATGASAAGPAIGSASWLIGTGKGSLYSGLENYFHTGNV